MSRNPLPREALADMVARRWKGQTLEEIADVWGTTGNNVRNQLNRYYAGQRPEPDTEGLTLRIQRPKWREPQDD